MAPQSTREGTIYFDPQDGIYKDHFPSCPIVPGSLIMQTFADLVSSPVEIKSFRFLSFVVPGPYTYRIEEKPQQWDCFLFQGGQMVARGTLRRGDR